MSSRGGSRERGREESPPKTALNLATEYPFLMQHLATQHLWLFRVLRDHFLFLTRSQIERAWTRPKSTTKKHLLWLVSEGYLERRYRADTFSHFQTPLYYLGKLGWVAVGNPKATYAEYRRRIEQRAEDHINHTLE